MRLLSTRLFRCHRRHFVSRLAHTPYALVAALLLAYSAAATATNGMNMIGYNTRSSGLGGADVALESDCAACNPATLGVAEGRGLSGGIAFLHPPVNFKNGLFGPNDVDSDDDIYLVPYLEYAQKLTDSPWTLGIAVRAQGGMGVEYDDVLSLTGSRDRLYTNLKIARVMPTASYRVNERLRIGGSLMFGFTEMDSDLYPESYSPGPDGIPGTADDFVGLRLAGVSGNGYAFRFGLHYQVSEKLGLGFTFLTETDIDMDGGALGLNLGLAQVTYAATLEDFALPAEAQLGLSYMLNPALRLVADVRWIDWASAIDEITVRGANPDIPVPLQNPVLTYRLKWKEQWVYAIGLEYQLDDRHTLRAGYNYGKNPVPNEYLVPLFPGHVEHHLTIGYGIELETVRFDLAWEHSLKNGETNTNPNPFENPFGPDSRVTANPGNVLHAGFTYRF